jgi:hypothetical protein
VKPPTFGLPMSIQSAILEIVLAWVSWPSRVPTISILMTHFIAREKNYSIPLRFFMMLGPPRVGGNMDGGSIYVFPLPIFYKNI